MSKERLDAQERRIVELESQLATIQRAEEIKRIIKDQDKGMPKYIFEMLKYMLAIIALLVAKDKAMSIPWIVELIK